MNYKNSIQGGDVAPQSLPYSVVWREQEQRNGSGCVECEVRIRAAGWTRLVLVDVARQESWSHWNLCATDRRY
jgi:hypothetical protein